MSDMWDGERGRERSGKLFSKQVVKLYLIYPPLVPYNYYWNFEDDSHSGRVGDTKGEKELKSHTYCCCC